MLVRSTLACPLRTRAVPQGGWTSLTPHRWLVRCSDSLMLLKVRNADRTPRMSYVVCMSVCRCVSVYISVCISECMTVYEYLHHRHLFLLPTTHFLSPVNTFCSLLITPFAHSHRHLFLAGGKKAERKKMTVAEARPVIEEAELEK